MDLLCQAAGYWRSVDDVRDALGGGAGAPPSLLTQRCALLMRFGDPGRAGVVRLCAAAARNFEPAGTAGALTVYDALATDDSHGGGAGGAGAPWDRGLYHGGALLSDADCADGRRACYECFLRLLRTVRTASAARYGAAQCARLDMRLLVLQASHPGTPSFPPTRIHTRPASAVGP